MPKVNPEILRWARETAGLNEGEAVEKLKITATRGATALQRLKALETGEVQPSRAMLVKMAKQYRRPLLTFYLSVPPKRGDRGEDFRTLPDVIPGTEEGIVDAVIRDIRARQELVKDVLLDEDDIAKLPFVGSVSLNQSVDSVVNKIVSELKFNLTDFRKANGAAEAFNYLRNQSEQAGIFTILVDNMGSHHTTISLEAFRGFALADSIAPFVAVNINDAKGAWSFTLLHEIVHLFLGVTGVSGFDGERRIERFCNVISSNILIPKNELGSLNINGVSDISELKYVITNFANARNVSSTMIAYNLFRSNRITSSTFSALKSSYKEDFLRSKALAHERGKESSGGPSYHVVRQHRLGTALVRLVERTMYSGRLSTTKAGRVLGVKAKNVHKVIDANRQSRRARLA